MNSFFGNALINDNLNCLILFINNAEHPININTIGMSIKINENSDSKVKEQILKCDINWPKEGINLEKKKYTLCNLIIY